MHVGASRIEVRIRDMRSLKEKRKVVKSIIADIGRAYPVAIAEAHVEYGHVGATIADHIERIGRRAGLADDRDVVLRVERGGNTATHDLMVVEKKYLDHERVSIV